MVSRTVRALRPITDNPANTISVIVIVMLLAIVGLSIAVAILSRSRKRRVPCPVSPACPVCPAAVAVAPPTARSQFPVEYDFVVAVTNYARIAYREPALADPHPNPTPPDSQNGAAYYSGFPYRQYDLGRGNRQSALGQLAMAAGPPSESPFPWLHIDEAGKAYAICTELSAWLKNPHSNVELLITIFMTAWHLLDIPGPEKTAMVAATVRLLNSFADKVCAKFSGDGGRITETTMDNYMMWYKGMLFSRSAEYYAEAMAGTLHMASDMAVSNERR